eukprot:2825868-Prymnesium_polylepis.1
MDAPDSKISEAAAREGIDVRDCAAAAKKGFCAVAATVCPVSCGTCRTARFGRSLQANPINSLATCAAE